MVFGWAGPADDPAVPRASGVIGTSRARKNCLRGSRERIVVRRGPPAGGLNPCADDLVLELNMNRTAVVCTSIASLAFMGAAALLTAGPLDPPAGPVAPSYKTLSDVEPRTAISLANTPGDADSVYRISQPGSYYLTRNIVGQADKSAIEIAASGVTIDLCGFEVGDSGIANRPAIIASGSLSAITVRNGSVRWKGGGGIALSGGTGARVEHVLVDGCGGTGITVGTAAVVSGCTVVASNGAGILAVSQARVEQCSTSQNAGTGVSTSQWSTIIGCVSTANAGNGFSVGFSSTVEGCSSSGNTGAGFTMGPGSSAKGCSAGQNALDGFTTETGCSLTDCTASFNDNDGFTCFNSTLTNCAAYENQLVGFAISGRATSCIAVGNGQNGFASNSGLIADSCSASSNSGDGFAIGDDSVLTRCRGIGNSGDGAQIGTDSLVEGCVFNTNTAGYGILVTGSANRIQNNQVASNLVGIGCTGTDSFVVGNSARANTTNYSLGTNEYGQIVVNPGAGFTTSNPWMNVAY